MKVFLKYLCFFLLFSASCSIRLSPEPQNKAQPSQEQDLQKDCPIYLLPPDFENVPVLLERFDMQLRCAQKKIIMDPISYKIAKGEKENIVVGIFSDTQSIFDLSVGCYDANTSAYLKAIRFHSFSATSQEPFNVTAIRMLVEPLANATKGSYQCAIYVCKVGSESYCSYPKPRDWPQWSGEKMAPGYNPYAMQKFEIIINQE